MTKKFFHAPSELMRLHILALGCAQCKCITAPQAESNLDFAFFPSALLPFCL